MPNAAAVLRAVHTVLRPGGRFVASITHPCSDMPFRRWERDEHGGKRWLCVDRYFERTPITFPWERFGEKVSTADLEDAARIPYYVFFDLVKPVGV